MEEKKIYRFFKVIIGITIAAAIFVGMLFGISTLGRKNAESRYLDYSKVIIDGETYDIKDTTFVNWNKTELQIVLSDGREIRTTAYTLVKE